MVSIRTSIFTLLIAVAAFSTGCGSSKKSATEDPTSVWMETDPIQCLANPWEEDWLSKPGRDYGDYPIGNQRVVEEPESEIIRDFFKRHGITVYEVISKPYPDDMAVCEACTCPAGYTLYLRVPLSDTEKLSTFNFVALSKP